MWLTYYPRTMSDRPCRRFRGTRRDFLTAVGGALITAGGATILPGCGRSTEAPSTSKAAPGLTALDADGAETLLALVHDLFPGPALQESHYRAAVMRLDALASDAATRQLLVEGLAMLRETDGGWASRPSLERLRRLHEIESTPFFQLVRYEAMTVIYADPSVWELYGYEGESFSKGGYFKRGFNDLDWLPEPEPSPWPV